MKEWPCPKQVYNWLQHFGGFMKKKITEELIVELAGKFKVEPEIIIERLKAEGYVEERGK